MSISSINVSAATVTQDNLEVTLVTDKESYSENEKIEATLTVKNNNETDVTNVDLETELPKGYKFADKSESKKTVESIAAGDSVSLSVTLEKETTPAEPSTDANSSTNPVSGGDENGEKDGSTNVGSTTNGSAIQTGQYFTVVGIVLLAMLIAGLSFVFVSRKRSNTNHTGKKLLSLFLCFGIVVPSIAFIKINTNAAETEATKKEVSIEQSMAKLRIS